MQCESKILVLVIHDILGHELKMSCISLTLVENNIIQFAIAANRNEKPVNSNTKHSLTECISEFYNAEQIHTARELLWKEYEQFLITVMKKTRRPQVPYDKETARPFADDISQWVFMIANAPNDSCFCQFYALDLTQVPPCRPEEVNIFSLVSRISALEKNDRDRQSMENIKPQRPQPSHPISECQPHTDQQMNVKFPVPVTASSAPPEETWAKVVNRNKKRIQKATARKEVRAAAKDLHVVVGTAGAKDVKACPPLKHIFVYKVSRGCTADSIRTLMKSNDVDPINIRITSKPSWLSSSFCISIAKDDFRKTFSEGVWPSGIRCREWISHVHKDRNNSNFDATNRAANKGPRRRRIHDPSRKSCEPGWLSEGQYQQPSWVKSMLMEQ
ncbi:hypothetical protein CAPTEDRAFT_209548 [Capitella teleta]|uniref:Uncharacterized protein n=1 Tax=Capitella teleta TaxID=283909 RepID=R7UKQ1_CAPTE|nr:hypothetical protein CAPTEDRAFT_209548 [Capitella teleta]|eukprot:ELU03852.1 hypothetical protein CAPTEDRAFT_209548 [Capitella teleta]